MRKATAATLGAAAQKAAKLLGDVRGIVRGEHTGTVTTSGAFTCVLR